MDWFTEEQTDNMRLSVKVKETLFEARSEFQHVQVVETEQYGTLLALDGFIQTNDVDEFVYHEMIAHVPLITHPNPRRVLIIGGGDGGAVRECVKHACVEHVDLVEIDGMVIDACRRFFPNISAELDNPRVKVHVADGIRFIQDVTEPYDVVIIDSSEPIGPGEGLFTPEFYGNVAKALAPDGLMVAQTESPWVNGHVVQRAYRGIRSAFPQVALYLANVPTYPTGMWSFTLGSTGHDPRRPVGAARAAGLTTRYYTPAVHQGAFALPPFVAALWREVEGA